MPNDQSGLFEVPSESPQAAQPDEPKITAQQVQQIRDAFAGAGIHSMEDRKALIESCTIRPVANIRELLVRDARPILRRIEQRKNYTGPPTGSSWDNREGETWIDRL